MVKHNDTLFTVLHDLESWMKIIINGENTEVEATALDQLLVELGYGNSRVATAVNGVFVAQGHRADCTLNEADRLEVVTPRQGG